LVQLEAWGQNAHFFRNKEINSGETWSNDLPYVVQGYLYVAANQVLTIEKGCRIYVHADAPIIIDGSLKVNGEKDTIDRVFFNGDRLDEPYKDFPASWPGIFFRTDSKDNVLNYAVIRNAYQAIAMENPSSNLKPKLILNECVIDNSYDAGIIALNSSITATNCLVSNCGKNVALAKGGEYTFSHCTIASYSNNYIQHKDPVLFVSNSDGTNTASLSALFRNCIFWGEGGTVTNEIGVYKKSVSSSIKFDNVLWKVQTAPQGADASGNKINQNPLFDSINISKNYYDFHLKSNPLSPAIDKGNPITIGTPDFDG